MNSPVGPEPPSRVVVLVKRFPRLSETFILNEFLELRRQGVPVELYAIKDPHEQRSQPEALALLPEVTYLQGGSIWRGVPGALRTARRHPKGTMRAVGYSLTRHSRPATRNLMHALILLDLMAEDGPAHLHAHFMQSTAAVAFIAHKVSGQPYSLTGHAKDIYTTVAENIVLRSGDARFVTTCTAANRAYLTDTIGLAPAHVRLCRHGVDVPRFSAVPRQPRPGRILSIGRLVPKKGFDVLIQACGELRRRNIDFDLRIVGGGELHDELMALAEREQIASRVRLIGSRPQRELVDELAAAEIFALSPVVLPNGDRDGVPNVILEAMAAGLPVIASNVSGLPEVITNGVTGRLVPPHRPDRLADVLAELLSDAPQRERLGAAGRRFVHEQFSWDNAVSPLRTLLLNTLAADADVAGDLQARG